MYPRIDGFNHFREAPYSMTSMIGCVFLGFHISDFFFSDRCHDTWEPDESLRLVKSSTMRL